MEVIISDLVKRFDKGMISRRELIGSLTMLAAVGGSVSGAEAQAAPFRSTRIDHISIQVTDLPRSIDFYEKVFGLSVLNEDTDNEITRMGTTRILVSLHRKSPTPQRTARSC